MRKALRKTDYPSSHFFVITLLGMADAETGAVKEAVSSPPVTGKSDKGLGLRLISWICRLQSRFRKGIRVYRTVIIPNSILS